MQSVSTNITEQAGNGLRVLNQSQRALISFLKTYNGSTSFFTIGSSTIGGGDIIKGDNSVIQEWDKYNYDDFSDRLIDLQYTRELDVPLGGMISAMADITLNNTDELLTPNKDATYGAYVGLKKRPIKLYTGFKGEAVPIFAGVTEKAPSVDVSNKVAKIHSIDNLSVVAAVKLSSAQIYLNYRIDQIISALLVLGGLTTSQFVLDTSITTIPYAFFDVNAEIGDIIKQLAQAEGGMFFQDEQGMYRYWNREHLRANSTPLWAFNIDNCYAISAPDVSNVRNLVHVVSQVRSVQALQKIWESTAAQQLAAGQNLDIFANFTDDFGAMPVTSVNTPLGIGGAVDSSYTANTNSDGSGDDQTSNVSVSATYLFATSYKMTFINNAAYPVYLTNISLYGTPAKVTQQIDVTVQDQTSIDKYDEQVLEIKNPFIQSSDWAASYGQVLLTALKDPTGVRDIQIPGIPQLQLGDLVTLDDGSGTGIQNFYVYKIAGTINSSGFVQNVRLIKATIETYFKIGISTIGGADKIAP